MLNHKQKIDSNIRITKKHDQSIILTIQEFILFLWHMKNYSLSRLKNKKNSKADV